MRPAEIEAQLRQQPFVPFRLCMSDGTFFEVRHPEMLIVSRTVLALAVYERDARVPERVVLCDPVHIIRIEPTDGRAKPKRRKGKPK